MLRVAKLLKKATIETRDELRQALTQKMENDPRIKELRRLNNRRILDMYDDGPVDFSGLSADSLIAKFGRGATYEDKYQSCLSELEKMVAEFAPKAQQALDGSKTPGKHFFQNEGDETYLVEWFEDQFTDYCKGFIRNLLMNHYSLQDIAREMRCKEFSDEVTEWMDQQLGDPHHDQEFNQAHSQFMRISQKELRTFIANPTAYTNSNYNYR